MQVPFKISLYDRSRKCAQGLWYDANFDQDLQAKRMVAEEACFKYNNLRPSDIEGQQKLLKELIADFGEEITILNGLSATMATTSLLATTSSLTIACTLWTVLK